MDEKVRPVVQRRRKFNEERHLIIREETHKLLKADHIREIQYPEWLTNVVLVQKANGKWRMCVDFTNLNRLQGLLSTAQHRLLGGQRLKLPFAEFPRRILGVQLDPHPPSR